MGEKNLPFYQLLKGNNTFDCTPECQKAFDKFKQILAKLRCKSPKLKGKLCLCT